MLVGMEVALERGVSLRVAKDRADATEAAAFRTCLETPTDESRQGWAKALKEQSAAEESYHAWRTTYLF